MVCDGLHVKVICDNQTSETHSFPKEFGDSLFGKSGWKLRIQCGINHMGCHDGLEAVLDQVLKRLQLYLYQALQRMRDLWQFMMGIGYRISVARKVLSTGNDPLILETHHEGQSQSGNQSRVVSEGPVPNDGIGGVCINIQYRGQIHVDTHRP
jgi:hypothetical protein